jgi:hypothetical protein
MQDVELRNLYSSLIIKIRRKSRKGYLKRVAQMSNVKKNSYNVKGRSNLKHIRTNWKIKLKWVLNKQNIKKWIRFIWLGVETSVVILEHGN